MNANDRYCPNCRQMVQPKRTTRPIVWQLALLTFFLSNSLLVLLGGPQLSGLEWLFIAAVGPSAILLGSGQRGTLTRCPICKSQNVEKASPTETHTERHHA